ncbi:transposase [Trichodesmium erythraeum IMS101]|uniref:Transposase n=1 Tax=Trichodesmium erythraeum (strain IMS101) TaxID=203124 RepID=Q10V85_TRIEI
MSPRERLLPEVTMFRLKVILGGKLRQHQFDAQAVELFIQYAMVNLMIQIGKPKTYKVKI